MRINAVYDDIHLASDYIRSKMKKKWIKAEEIDNAVLNAEKVLNIMIDNTKKTGGKIYIYVIPGLGTMEIRIISRGSFIDLSELQNIKMSQLDYDEADETANEAVQSFLDRAILDKLSFRRRHDFNIVTINVFRSKYRQLILTLVALVMGVLIGFFMKNFISESISSMISSNVFVPVSSMFLNALKMVVGPLVFFSIASSVADFKDMRTLGKVVGKIVLGYMITSLVAIILGILTWHVFPIGNRALQKAVDVSAVSSIAGQNFNVSVKDTIVGIIPKDVVSPFLNSNMLQIIFISLIIGIAVGSASSKFQMLKSFLTDGYVLFSKITCTIIRVMPLAIFCSMAKMVLTINLKTLMSVFTLIPVCYISCILMLIIYGLIILILANLNPLKFFKKYYPAMLTAYTFASSNAALPSSMEYCGNSLGVSRRIYSISLPLGATINMDGSCIILCLTSLFIAKSFGISVTSFLLAKLALYVFVLSIGAPAVPGSMLVCLSILLPQINIPSEALSLIMGLSPLLGMILCIPISVSL